MMELAGIKLAEWAVAKVADRLWEQVEQPIQAKLNRDDLQQAIGVSLQAAEQYELATPPDSHLFYHCDDKQERTFKRAVFSNADVCRELHRPFCDQGRPRLEFLRAGFEKVAQEKQICLSATGVQPWLEQFIDTYFKQTSETWFRLAKQDYCEQLVKWYGDVKFAGIAVEGQVIDEAKDLTNIFVMPDAIGEGRRGYGEERFLLADREGELPRSGLTRDLMREQWRQEQGAKGQWSGQRVLATQLLQQTDARKVVLLGAPGSGKTTLMSYFAVQVARNQAETLGLATGDWLPILIRIRDLAVKAELGVLGQARQFAEKSMCCMPLPQGFFEAWLERGRALILLDGLDEVAEEGKRQDIVRTIDSFLGQFGQNRAIVTSRPAGYRRDFFRTEEYPHYLLQPFDDEKMAQFISNWYDSRTLDRAESERRQESLKKALAENSRIQLLARNPLLLTIVALIHRYQAELPRERFKLYDKAVETLLTTWDRNREITFHRALQYLRLDDLRRIMERLAYWIHTQGSGGDGEGGTLIDREELLDQLSLYIREQKKLERYEARSEAERFLKHIRERTGLLNEQGQDCYAFVHKTFQEYLAAQEIHDRKEDDFEVVLQHIRDHLHDAHWREVLLLLIAQQKRSNPAKCLREILKCPDPYAQWLHRNLFFAGACLAEKIPVSDETLVDQILDGLVALEISDAPWVSSKIKRQVFRTLVGLYETEFAPQALKKLMDAPIGQIEKIRLQRYRAELGDREGATVALLNLCKDEDSFVRYGAAEALGRLGKVSDTVVETLLTLCKDEDRFVRYSAAWALGRLGKASDAVVNALLTLCKDEDSLVRSNADWALGRLSQVSDAVVEALLDLCKDENDYNHVRAAAALGKFDQVSDVANTLLSLCKNKNSLVRISAAEALGRLSQVSDAVVEALLDLRKDEDSLVRISAAGALGKLGQASNTVVNALLNLCKDRDSDVRSSAAGALGKLGEASDTVVNTLLNLYKDENRLVRSSAAGALGKLGKASDTVVNTLLNLYKNENRFVRSCTADALGKLGKASDTVVQALFNLCKDQDRFVRSSAAAALGQLGKKDPSIVPTLKQWLEQNPDADGTEDAIDALWELVSGESVG